METRLIKPRSVLQQRFVVLASTYSTRSHVHDCLSRLTLIDETIVYVAMEMQRKGMLTQTKSALNRQVDEIMSFDDPAFEAFKRSVANLRPVENIKTASDLGGVNVGTSDEGMEVKTGSLQEQLENMGWS